MLLLPHLFGTPLGFNGTLFSFRHEDNGCLCCVTGVYKVEPCFFKVSKAPFFFFKYIPSLEVSDKLTLYFTLDLEAAP